MNDDYDGGGAKHTAPSPTFSLEDIPTSAPFPTPLKCWWCLVRFVRPDKIVMHMEYEPFEDKLHYNQWMADLTHDFPFLHVAPLQGSERTFCYGTRETKVGRGWGGRGAKVGWGRGRRGGRGTEIIYRLGRGGRGTNVGRGGGETKVGPGGGEPGGKLVGRIQICGIQKTGSVSWQGRFCIGLLIIKTE